jgi:hypothetical protein
MTLNAQEEFQNGFSFKPSMEFSRFNYVEFGFGQGPDYYQFKSQFRSDLKGTLFYNSKFINMGFGASLIGFGERVPDSNMERLFPLNYFYWRTHYKAIKWESNPTDYFGPYLEIAKTRQNFHKYYYNFAFKLGLEYQRENLSVGINYGLFSSNKEGRAILTKNNIERLKNIYQIGLDIGYSLPR